MLPAEISEHFVSWIIPTFFPSGLYSIQYYLNFCHIVFGHRRKVYLACGRIPLFLCCIQCVFIMEDPMPQDSKSRSVVRKIEKLPPTPPYSEDNASNSSDEEAEVDIPLPPPSTHPSQTLDIDKKTPDAHVPRDPRLIRLTGVHPFNVEAPLSALFGEGFLTSPDLFYVRNHGAVPEVKDEDIPNWEFTVEG